MDILKEIKRIKELGNGYFFIQAMQSLSEKAADGDDVSLEILETMIDECRLPSRWKENSRYCSAVVNALAHARTSKSYKIFMNFIESLPDDMPYGAVDLLGALLPVYKKIVLGPVKRMAQSDNYTHRAIGMYALCNIAMENDLGESEVHFFLDLLEKFEGDKYFPGDFVEMARSYIKKHFVSIENQEDIFDGILIGM